MVCPLCLSAGATALASVYTRRYFDCPVCGLIFMDPSDHPDPGVARTHYLTHENDPADTGYRGLLSRLVDPMIERLAPGSEGLDFGSGPGPAVSVMMGESGFPVRNYDPLFLPDAAALSSTYSFITCTETAEHFSSPRTEFERLDTMLRPGGWLGILTEWFDRQEFAKWRYARDPTHLVFYRRDTMEWIGRRWNWQSEFPAPNVTLFGKKG